MVVMRQQTSTPTANVAPTAAQHLATLEQQRTDLLERTRVIRTNLGDLQAEHRKLDTGDMFRGRSDAGAKVANAARELLNGAAIDLLPAIVESDEQRRTALEFKIAAANRALDEADRLAGNLEGQIAREKLRVYGDDIKALLAEGVDAVIALERFLQKKDAFFKKLKLPFNSVPLLGWPLLGRLGRSESAAYRYLQVNVAVGGISQERFDAEVNASRQTLV
jgi:hypothetical protein